MKLRCQALLSVIVSVIALLAAPFAVVGMYIEEKFFYSYDPVDCGDGSEIVNEGGPTYRHELFDGYVLYSGDEYLSSYIYYSGVAASQPYAGSLELTQRGYYARHAFDPAGYIAYYRVTGL